MTAPRLAVLEALDNTEGHVTADEVRREVVARIGSVSVQAAYDVLAALSRAGLIRCIETRGHPARYEAAASSFRGSDKRRGGNGARIRFEAPSHWEVDVLTAAGTP